ncbi:exoribonuclease II [Buchnera aphidicola]|uniref:exoribonuclease II n=1 Tax=Buchnera aphidicola TaxID=9 RepID=UPI0031B7FCB6
MLNESIILEKKKRTEHLLNDQIIGVVKKYNENFGLFKIKNKYHYFIPNQYIKNVMHGDRVVSIIINIQNKILVKPVFLIKPFLNIFIGIIKCVKKKIFIKPEYPLLNEYIICEVNKNICNIKDGNLFFAQLVQHKLINKKNFLAKLIKFVVSKNDKFLSWKIILSYYNFEYQFPKNNNFKLIIQNEIYRTNLTHLEFITIDHDYTNDIDDAIFIKKKNDFIKIIIAISDPTAYIREGSELDIIASKRLFTNYLPGFSIPMLPKKFSENLFSLFPGIKKPVLACKIKIDNCGNVLDNVHFFLAWIKSHHKLTYNNITNWIDKKTNWKPKKTVRHQISLLHVLCKKRILWRKKNALIFKDHPEYKFHFSDTQDVINISMEYRNIAQKMVEEVMILANVSAAKFLSKNLGWAIYNIHNGFTNVNAKHVSSILKINNINIDYTQLIDLVGFCKFKRLLEKKPNDYIECCIRKYQSCSTLSITPKPHFALGFPEYLTWTSPIRKYSDMINHRLLKNIILGYSSIKLKNDIIKNIINCKHRHRIVKKKIENCLYANFFYNTNKLNQVFEVKIFNILPYGIKARVLVNGAIVFIPNVYIYSITSELFCDQKNGILYLNNQELYRVSDKLKVIISNINLSTYSILAKPYKNE